MSKAQISTEYLVMITVLLVIVGVMFVFSLQTAQQTVGDNMVSNALNSLEKTINEVYALGPDTQLYAEIDLPESITNSTVSGKSFGFEVASLSGASNSLTEAKALLVGTLPKTPGKFLVRVRMRSDGKIEVGKGLHISPANSSVSLFPGEQGTIDLVAYNETYDTIYLNEFDIHQQFGFVSNITLQDLSGNSIPVSTVLTGSNVIAVPAGGDFQFRAVVTIPSGMTPGTIADPNYVKTTNGIEGEFDMTVTVKQELTDVSIGLGSVGAAPAPANNSTIYFADAAPAPDTAYFVGPPSVQQSGIMTVNITALNQAGQPAAIAKGIKTFTITDPNGVQVVSLANQDIPFAYSFHTTVSTVTGTYTVYVETDPLYTKNTVIKTTQFAVTEKVLTMAECFEFAWLNTQFMPPGAEQTLMNWRMHNICATRMIQVDSLGVEVLNDLDAMQLMSINFGGTTVWGAGAQPPSPPQPPSLASPVLTRDPAGNPFMIPGNADFPSGNLVQFTNPFANDEGEQYKFKFNFTDGTNFTTPQFSAPPTNDATCVSVDWTNAAFTATQPTGSEFGGFTISNSCEKPITLVSTVIDLAQNPNQAMVRGLTYAGQPAYGPNGAAATSTTIPHTTSIKIPSKSSVSSNIVTTSVAINQSGQKVTLTLGFPSGPTYSTQWQPNLTLQSACIVFNQASTHTEAQNGGNPDTISDFAFTNTCAASKSVVGLNIMVYNNPLPLMQNFINLQSNAFPPQWMAGMGGGLGVDSFFPPLTVPGGFSVTSNDLQFTSPGAPPGAPYLMAPYYAIVTFIMGDFSRKSFTWPQTNMQEKDCFRGFGGGTWDSTGLTYTGSSITNICDATKPIKITDVTVNDITGGANWMVTTFDLGGGSVEYFDSTGTKPGTNIDLVPDTTVSGNSSISGNSVTFTDQKSVQCRDTQVVFTFGDASQSAPINIKDTTNCG